MKNIGLIINSLQGGGAERCAADLSIYFSQNGYRVYIFTDLSIEVKYEYSGTLVNFRCSFQWANNSKENPLLKKVGELKELKKKYHIDIAISFMQLANYINILSKEEEKVILTTHSLNSEYAKFENNVFWSEQTFKELYQYADVITFPSDYCRNDWLTHYGDDNNITRTIYNPVHLMQRNENAYRKNIVIAIGRMQGIKRQWHLIRAFKLVREECPNSRLVILGEGELRETLEALIKELGLEHTVELPGNVKNVEDYLAQAKVFAITSRCEAMPCSVLEAMSAGVPVVACDIPGGIREELGITMAAGESIYPIQGKCGIITPYIKETCEEDFSYEERCLAEEIIHLLKDEALRKDMERNAIELVEKFTVEKIGSIWVQDIFSNCLNRMSEKEKFAEIRDRHLAEFNKQNNINVNMYVSYYKLLEKWMVLKEQGKKVSITLERKKWKRIIIYGLGKMANHLIAELKDSTIYIVCAIDKAAIKKYGDFPIITGEDGIPNADCIIVTPIYEYHSIKERLEEKTSVPVISLEEIIDSCK